MFKEGVKGILLEADLPNR